jgi:hypothetical protein
MGWCGTHPMYTGNVIMIVGIPLALGSYWGLVFVIPGLILLALRIRDEEKLLQKSWTDTASTRRRFAIAWAMYVVTAARPAPDTEEYGVDIVLNSVTGAAQRAGLEFLVLGGRFVEIGKRDI